MWRKSETLMQNALQRLLRQHDFVYERAPMQWLDGIPLANGDMGAMIWGNGQPLILTLDSYRVWETRTPWPGDDPRFTYATLRRLKDQKRWKEYEEVALRRRNMRFTDNPPPIPTRLCLGRMEIEWPAPPSGFDARLDLFRARAEGVVRFRSGKATFSTFVCSTRNILVVDIRCDRRIPLPVVRLVPAPKDKETELQFRCWNYPEPEVEMTPSGQVLRRSYSVDKEYTITTREVRSARRLTVFLTITADSQSRSPRREKGISALVKEHEVDWARFWNRSAIILPDSRFESLYYAELYKHYCSSRPGHLPVTLQGLWTTDGSAPPWRGSFTTDMNVEESYWPIYTSNHLESGAPLYDTYWRNLPYHRKLGRYWYGKPFPIITGEHGPGGEPFPGYFTDEHSPGHGAWIAHHFWLHWLYSRDRRFLRERAYPFLREFLRAYLHIIEKRADGKYHIPFTDTPEYYEGDPKSMGDDTNYDLMLLHFLLDAALSAQEELPRRDPDCERWSDVQKNLVEYPTERGALALRPGEPLALSHRHHSHLIGIYPLGVLDAGRSQAERELVEASVANLVGKGVKQWTGWSFPWASMIAGRAGNAALAHSYLQTYLDTFVASNSFHVNGDHRKTGVSVYQDTTMTLEGGFAAAAAILEMLLQSHHGLIRIFPTCPPHWREVQFANLRAEGAFIVSARRSDGQVRFVEIISETGGTCRVRNPFGSGGVLVDTATKKGRRIPGDVVEFATARGGRYLLTADGQRVSNVERRLTVPKRSASERHSFGLKQKSALKAVSRP